MVKKYTTNFIAKEIKRINPKLKLLTEYEYSKKKIKLICECEAVFEKTWYQLKQSPRCANCSYKRGAKERTFNIDDIKIKLQEKGFEYVSGEYVNAYSDINIKCARHDKKILTNYSKLLKGYGCSECAKEGYYKNRSFDIDKVKYMLEEINPSLKITDKIYINSKTKMNVKCNVCGHEFLSAWEKLGLGRGCRECSYENRKGEKNPSFNHDITDDERSERRMWLRGESMNVFRGEVFERDDYTCQICFERGGRLNAHHLNGYHWFRDGRYDSTNGVTLCENCHLEFHKIYGKKHNTKEQFIDFKKATQNE